MILLKVLRVLPLVNGVLNPVHRRNDQLYLKNIMESPESRNQNFVMIPTDNDDNLLIELT